MRRLLSDSAPTTSGRCRWARRARPRTLDPAASWDGSWELFRNIYQTLLSYPTGATTPQPDAAKSCAFTDAANTAYRCDLRAGLKFSNGETLDAKAVKHSIDRIRKINVNGGPAGLLGSLDRVQATGRPRGRLPPQQAGRHLPVRARHARHVDRRPRGVPGGQPSARTARSPAPGPYVLESYKEGKQAELVRNDSYKGFADRKNNAVTIRYFQDSATMVNALKNKEIDVTYRGLAAADIVDLQDDETPRTGIQLVENAGTEISYLVFNPKDPWAGKLAVRRAIAQIVDRAAHRAQGLPGTPSSRCTPWSPRA